MKPTHALRAWALSLAILTVSNISVAEDLLVPGLWGKKESDLEQVFAGAKKAKGAWTLENWRGWKSVMLVFDDKTHALEMLFFTPTRLLSEAEAKAAAQDQLGLSLPPADEVRAVGLITYREMKGKISTINFTYEDPRADQRIREIGVFFNLPMVMRPGQSQVTPAPKGGLPPLLGLSLDECTARYGKPTDGASGTKIFRLENVLVRCRFFGGTCESTEFLKTAVGPFSDEEFQSLREASGGRDTWERTQVRLGGETWISPASQRLAVRWTNAPFTVVIQTRASFERLGRRYKEQLASLMNQVVSR